MKPIRLDEHFLADLGLGELSPRQKNQLLAMCYEALERRVGQQLAAVMSDRQTAEFEAYVNTDEEMAMAWLAENLPEYGETVRNLLEDLSNHLRAATAVRDGEFTIS